MVDLTFEDESEVTRVGDAGSNVGEPDPGQLGAGVRLGRYVVLETLGAGGMGVVYAAYDPELDRKIAVKVLRPGAKRRGTEGRARLLREAQALARLSHPNVVAVHDVGTLDDKVFVAMEFIAGRTLGSWLRERPRTPADIVGALVEAGRGLAAAHAAGLVHRDFKPENVMVRADGRVVVMDFGIARAADAERVEPDVDASVRAVTGSHSAATLDLTATGAMVGTPAYMAPEQHLGGDVDARSDQFAFCVTLYEALYGERPFAGDRLAAVAYQVSQGIVRDPPPGVRVPARLRRVILRGLSVDPQRRFESMSALSSALEQAVRGRGRWMVGSALLLAAGAMVAVAPVLERRAQMACAAEGTAIEQRWGDPARERVRAGLEASGVADADAFARVQPWLDRYAADWSRVREEACLAHTVRETRSQALAEAAVDCLEERADALEVLVDELARGDREVAIRAVEAATNLPAVGACEEERRLIARVAPPAPETREQVRAARRDLARASMLIESGRYGDAEKLLTDVSAVASSLDYAPLSAEAALALGQAKERTGKYDEALARLEDAFVGALGVAHDEVTLDAANSLLYLTGAKLARAEEAMRWERIGRQLLHRLAAEDGIAAARIDMSLGTVVFAAGDYERARAAFERGLASYESKLGADHPMVATAHNNLGILALVRGDYEQALDHHRRALGLREALLGPKHPVTAQSYGNRANVHYARGHYQLALEDYQRALDISEQVFGSDHPDVAMQLNNIGNAYDSLGDGKKALELYARALATRERAFGPEHPMVAQTLHNMGIVNRGLGEFSTAHAQMGRAIEIKAKVLGATHPSLGGSLLERGRLWIAEQRFAEARGDLERAVTIAEGGQGSASDLAECRFALAQALAGDRTDLVRARALAEQALGGLPEGEHEPLRAKLRDWLAQHPQG